MIMREILFRGKAVNREDGFNYRSNYKNGDWVYGLITKNYNEKYDLATEMTNERGISGIEVDYKTIGQFTGLSDENDVKIFEGDIVKYGNTLHEVVFCDFADNAYFGIWFADRGEIWAFSPSVAANRMTVVGNIHDNPELIEDGDDDEEP